MIFSHHDTELKKLKGTAQREVVFILSMAS